MIILLSSVKIHIFFMKPNFLREYPDIKKYLKYIFMSLLLFLSCFLDISGLLFRSSYSQQSKGVGEPQKQTSNVQNRDSKSKRDTKNSILVSISGNMAEKFSDSLCSSENHFGLYFQKTRPEIYYFLPALLFLPRFSGLFFLLF